MRSRNDSCWCGSNEKYKRCHLEFDERLSSFKAKGYPVPHRKLVKSTEDLIYIRKACRLTKDILDELSEKVTVGISTEELDHFVHQKTINMGAIPASLNYHGFPRSCCISINEVICHGIPSERRLIEGDIVNIDVNCIINNRFGDSCRMYSVGKISKQAQQLIDGAKACLEAGIRAVKPWQSVSLIGEAIHEHADQLGYSVVDMFGGHGVGNAFHEDPFIFHCRRKEKQMILVPGMVFTIEPMINEGKKEGKVLSDGWTAITQDGKLSAQWEHTILVTENGAEVLT